MFENMMCVYACGTHAYAHTSTEIYVCKYSIKRGHSQNKSHAPLCYHIEHVLFYIISNVIYMKPFNRLHLSHSFFFLSHTVSGKDWAEGRGQVKGKSSTTTGHGVCMFRYNCVCARACVRLHVLKNTTDENTMYHLHVRRLECYRVQCLGFGCLSLNVGKRVTRQGACI